MARFTRMEVAAQMEASGLVPLFYHPDPSVAKEVLRACYEGGARLLEFTHRGDFAQEVFRELSLYCRAALPEMILGVGSITDGGTAAQYLNLGANFVVTPVFREDIARACNRRKVLWSPGCGSLTEIAQAEEWGCEIVKLFPGSTYGPGFVKAVLGPQPWTRIMPTGGVTPEMENLAGWFQAGVTCVGMGSKLIRKDWVKEGVYEQLTATVKETLARIAALRSPVAVAE
ncbi:MAG: bifunctional 4-hydroxy-2-oxoglutarate aldolase/2-dehydro-3-deoxy-phosphogluconate aldolase [Bacteroidota bacterium]